MEVVIQDDDVLKLIISFLQSKGYFWSANSLKLEADVMWDVLPKPLTILKDCALDGKWKDVRKLLQPFHDLYQDQVNWKSLTFLLYRQQFCELCFEGELENASTALKDIINEVTCCHTNDEYDAIVEDVCNYYNGMLGKFTPVYALKQATRTDTFRQLLALVYPVFEANNVKILNDNSRLKVLLAKGLLYDYCDKYCYEKACGKMQPKDQTSDLKFRLNPESAKPVSSSLLGWIQSLEEERLFRNRFIDRDVKIVERDSLGSQQNNTLIQSQQDHNRFDSTFVKTQTTSSPPQGDDLAPTLDKKVVTNSSQVPSNENNFVAPQESLPNASIRSAWGDTALPEVTKEPEQRERNFVTQVVPIVAPDGDGNLLKKSADASTHQMPRDNYEGVRPVEQAALNGSQSHAQEAVNPALWAQPGNTDNTSLKTSIRDSYADFINEQSIARRDYNKLMDQLQAKQNEAQALRNFLQGGESLLKDKKSNLSQNSCGASVHLTVPSYASKSVDANARSQDIRQQFAGKTSHTDRGVARAPHPLQSQTLSQQTSSPGVADSTSQNSAGKHSANLAFQQKAQPTVFAPQSAIDPTPHQEQHPQTISGEVKQPPAYELPFGYAAIYRTDDPAVIRSVAFHPRGHVMAVGSNSRVLKLCAVPESVSTPASRNMLTNSSIERLQIIMKKSQVHRGSLYALAWNDAGNILSTCSNDKLIKIFTFDEELLSLHGPQYELTHHDGMVRDVTFLRDYGSGSVLASGGSTDFVVYTYACEVDTVVHQLTGHSDQILSLYSWNGGMLASASQDRSVRLWDLRSSRCVSVLGFGKSSDEHSVPTSVCVDSQGHCLAVGRDDSLVSVYDLRAGRLVGDYAGHSGEVRSVRFNPNNKHLLMSSSYDGTALVTNINLLFNGSATLPISSRRCNLHTDKVIQCRWHHQGACFATTSADQSCVLWRTIEA